MGVYHVEIRHETMDMEWIFISSQDIFPHIVVQIGGQNYFNNNSCGVFNIIFERNKS